MSICTYMDVHCSYCSCTSYVMSMYVCLLARLYPTLAGNCFNTNAYIFFFHRCNFQDGGRTKFMILEKEKGKVVNTLFLI